MQAAAEFRLSELYLACRTLGPRHDLTQQVLRSLARLASPAVTEAVMRANKRHGHDSVMPFRRHPVDLQFVCLLAGSNGGAVRSRFMVCSDEALGYAGALQFGLLEPIYSVEESPGVPVVLDAHAIACALDTLAQPDIHRAQVSPHDENADALRIRLPARLLPDPRETGTTVDWGSAHCLLYPPTGKAEKLKPIHLRQIDTQHLRIDIGQANLLICHHAGLVGMPFDLITPLFTLKGRFPDLLSTGTSQTVAHNPVGVLHPIFCGLDRQLLALPTPLAQALRKQVHWLDHMEFAT